MSDQYNIKYGGSSNEDPLVKITDEVSTQIYKVYFDSETEKAWVEVASSKDTPFVVNQIKPEK